MFINCRRNIVI